MTNLNKKITGIFKMKNLFTKNYWAMKGFAMLVLVVMGGSVEDVMGQASITSSSAVTDALAGYLGTSATFPANWTLSSTGTANNGTNQTTGTAGGWYGNGNISFLGSGSATNGNATWLLQNNSGATITGFTLAFTARLWKNGTNSPSVTVSYSNSGTITNPTAGALTNALSSLTFNDATTNVSTGAARTQTVTGLTIANGQYIFVRFIHPGGSSSDNLGWDDLSFTPTLALAPEINIKQSSTSYATASTYAFGNQISGTSSSATAFTIENTGNATLNLTGTPKIAISGSNSSEFTIDQTSTTTTVAASGTTSFTVTFSPTSTGAKSAVISIDNDDANGSENPYVINLTGTGTVNSSSASDIITQPGYTYSSNIDYASKQTATTLTTANSVGVNGLTLRDGGVTTDADALGTTLTDITFSTGGSTAIRTAALFDGATNIAEVAVNGATSIVFTGLSLIATDGATKDFELRVTYQATVTDNQQITFTVSSATASALTSNFANASAGAAASTATNDINRLEVTATLLAFVQQTSNVLVNSVMSPSPTISANDALANRDLDYVTNMTATTTGTFAGGSTNTVTPVNGLGTFSNLQFSAFATGKTIAITSGSLTASGNSSLFNITVQEAGLLLLEDNFTYSTALSSNGYSVVSSGINTINATASGLIYTSYGSSNIGNAIILNNTGEDVFKTYTSQNPGAGSISLYFSAIVNISTVQTAGDYFICLGENTSGTSVTFKSRVFVKQGSTSSKVIFGLSNTSSPTYNVTEYDINTPILLVVKHTFSSTTSTSNLFINPSLYTEPNLSDITDITATTVANGINAIVFRQGNSASAPTLIIDGIRVASNWGTLVGNPQYSSTSNIAAGNYNSLNVLSGTLTATGNINIYNGSVTVASGATLSTGGNLILKSDANGTASIGNSAGTITGNITVERYIPALRKFRFLASPVVGATAANWRNNGTNTAGIGTHITGGTVGNNFDQSTTNAASAFWYNELLAGSNVTVGSGATSDPGWTAFADGNSEALTNGKGFRILVRGDRTISLTGGTATANPTTLSVTGTYPANSVSIATTKTNSNTNSGFNLVGNPYPATIDWNAVTKGTDISATYTIYDPTSNSYKSWNGTSGDASRYIASGQAFFVQQLTGTTSSITIDESDKVTNAAGNYFRNKLTDHLKVSMTYDSANYDAAFIHFRADALNDFDTYDGLKFQNAGVNIASVGSDGKRYNINSLASLTETTEMPLSVLGSVLTNFELKFEDVESFKNHELYLIDHHLNKMLLLSDGFTYPITLSSDSASVKDGRFKIVFVQKATGINPNEKISNAFILYPNPAAHTIHLLLDAKNTNNENVSYEIFNQLGARLQQGSLDFTTAKDQTIAIDNLAQGIYFIKLQSNSNQQTIKFIK
jgi:hypothetical protein